MTEPILHLISEDDWGAAQSSDQIVPDSLTTEGFVHCSTHAQIDGVVERYYAGRTDMLVLVVDPDSLGDAELKWDAPAHPDGTPNTDAEQSERYPHVYGPIPVSAVLGHHLIA